MVPEGRGVFARMTITENLQMGAYIRKDKAGILADIEKMFTIFPRLRERKTSWPAPCRAANSKCWPWAAR